MSENTPPVYTGRGDDGTATLLDSGRMPEDDSLVGKKDLEFVENALEEWRGHMELPNEFIVPGESRTGTLRDGSCPLVRRSVVRCAERSLVVIGYSEEHTYAIRVVNRLSDLPFILVRNAYGESLLSKGA